MILQGEVSHLYLRAPSIGLVPPLQQPGSQIENLTSKCFQLPAVFFLALYSYRNLNIQNPCVTHFKSSKMDLTYTNQSRERCQRNLSTQNCIENDCNTPQTFTTCFPASVFLLRTFTAPSNPSQGDRTFSHSSLDSSVRPRTLNVAILKSSYLSFHITGIKSMHCHI